MNDFNISYAYPVKTLGHASHPYIGQVIYSIDTEKFYIYTSECKWVLYEECNDYIKQISGCDRYVFLKSELDKITDYDKVYVVQEAKVYKKVNGIWIKNNIK